MALDAVHQNHAGVAGASLRVLPDQSRSRLGLRLIACYYIPAQRSFDGFIPNMQTDRALVLGDGGNELVIGRPQVGQLIEIGPESATYSSQPGSTKRCRLLHS